jgi:hypothetical protein
MIKPNYITERANAPILLGKERAEIGGLGYQLLGDCEVKLEFLPRFRVVMSITCPWMGESASPLQLFDRSLRLRYGHTARLIPVMALRSSGPPLGPGSTRIDFLSKSGRLVICADRRKRLSSIVAHVANFLPFLSVGDGAANNILQTTLGGQRVAGRVILRDTDWQIEIEERPEADKLFKQLAAEGGYALTHVCRITRNGAQTFSISAAERILRELHLFLSFARGAWVGLVAPVGIDTDGRKAYEDWSVRLSTPWEPARTWFDKHHGHCLATLFPGFTRLHRDPHMGKALSTALYWYLRSNRAGEGAGVDSGIILSQAALERLALAHLETTQVSAASKAATTLRRAWQHLRLPGKIPRDADQLQRGRRKRLWTDSAEAITRVRNELVHPKSRLGVRAHDYIPEAWNLSQWYIELFILRLCDYGGPYSNRFRSRWIGQVENMPWVRTRRSSKGTR